MKRFEVGKKCGSNRIAVRVVGPLSLFSNVFTAECWCHHLNRQWKATNNNLSNDISPLSLNVKTNIVIKSCYNVTKQPLEN